MTKYTIESLKVINQSYHQEHQLNQFDVDKVNELVRLIEGSRNNEFPQARDIVEYTNQFGCYFGNAHIENVDEDDMRICERPHVPFVDNQSAGNLHFNTSGGIWRRIPKNLELVGTRIKYFTVWGHEHKGALQFVAVVNVWGYSENGISYSGGKLTLGEMEDCKIYAIRQNEGYSSGVFIRRDRDELKLVHFWINDKGNIRLTEFEGSGDKPQYVIMKLSALNYIEPKVNKDNFTLDELYGVCFLDLYDLRNEGKLSEDEFELKDTVSNLLELPSKFYIPNFADTTIGEMEEGKIYALEQERGYCEGVFIRKDNDELTFIHFWKDNNKIRLIENEGQEYLPEYVMIKLSALNIIDPNEDKDQVKLRLLYEKYFFVLYDMAWTKEVSSDDVKVKNTSSNLMDLPGEYFN